MIKAYPNLVIDVSKIRNNTKIVRDLCMAKGIELAGVIKGFNGIPEVAEAMAKSGCKQLASSRMEQLKEIKLRGHGIDTLLLRIPMLSELDQVVKYADISLQSEKTVLEALNDKAQEQGVRHRVILMRDLGDLREGVMTREALIELALFVEKQLKHIILEGIGCNLSCYGSILPTVENMSQLVSDARAIEEIIQRPLRYVSGGATTTLPLLHRDLLPEGINHLRVGEGIICAMDLPLHFKTDIEGLQTEVFTIEAEIIELAKKPSYPIGEKCVNAFGEVVDYEDKGERLRALLALGNRDVGSYTALVPLDEGVELVGASSDHLILDVENSVKDLKVGDILSFGMFYQGVLYATDKCYMNIEMVG